MAILSESAGNSGSVQRLTAQAERRRLGTNNCKYGGADTMNTNVSKKEKTCCDCKTLFMPTSNRQRRCVNCIAAEKKERLKQYHKKTYIRKGYNQKGENNNNWTGGIGIYRAIKLREECERCGSTSHLLTHHKDEDRYNNAPENLECLCKKCHQNHHRKPLSEEGLRKLHGGRRAFMARHGKDLFDENGKFKKVCKV